MNPWANAANAYGQELDRLTQIQGQGMQQQAQLPMQLYQSFTQGYRDAQERKDKELAQKMAQQQYERQMMLAEETARNNQAREEASTARLKSKDATDNADRTMRFFHEQVDPNFTGAPDEASTYVKQAVMAGIPEQVAIDYFNTRKTQTQDQAQEYDLGGNPVNTPKAVDSYRPGVQYLFKKAAESERNRAAVEIERLKAQGEERAAAALSETSRHNRATESAMLAKLNRPEAPDKLKQIPTGMHKSILENKVGLAAIDKGIAALKDEIKNGKASIGMKHKLVKVGAGAVTAGSNELGDKALQVYDPEGIATRAILSDIGNQRLHDMSGAAVTLSEDERFKPVLVQLADNPTAGLKKLEQLRDKYASVDANLRGMYAKENGYNDSMLGIGGGKELGNKTQGGGPMVGEASKLKDGVYKVGDKTVTVKGGKVAGVS